ncbi:MAG: ActS/PrrB/RegB family redox-sensitive histidine kinase [Pseudomonadota bacterium]
MDTNPSSFDAHPSQWVRLRTLINLRWLAVTGQIVAVVVAELFLNLQLRLDLCITVIGLAVALNIASLVIHPVTKRLNPRDALLALFFDLSQLTFLLYLTGGLNNPFAVLILAPTVISATVLSLGATMFMGLVTLGVVTLLIFVNIPLVTHDGRELTMPPLLIYGMWTSLTISVAFLSGYTRRVSTESRSMAEALTATQLALERERKLTALGGVVAAAAHELGTPLATIKLVSGELAEELRDDPVLLEDVELIRSQTERCRTILAEMGRSGKEDLHVRHAPILAVVQEAAEPHQDRGIRIVIRVDGALPDENVTDQPTIPRHPEIVHGLRNLVQNAVDFARETVWIDVDWTPDEIQFVVGDDGRGFPADMMDRIGDPFMRRRDGPRETAPNRTEYQGMGLGLFIAKTLLERTGARLSFANGSERKGRIRKGTHEAPVELARATGALIEVRWARPALEVTKDATRGPLGQNKSVPTAARLSANWP